MKRSLDESHTQIWNILVISDAFLDQKTKCIWTRGNEGTMWGFHVTQSLLLVHIHLSSDQERHLWSLKYFKFPCVCVYFCLEISSFFGEFSLSFPIYWVFIHYIIVLEFTFTYGRKPFVEEKKLNREERSDI